MNNFEGYDVDPGMVRISQVNMYLHHFKNPKIFNYNTLSQEERWGDKYNVILANPPFMSPKGGVSPHKKFSVASNRAEVLFVDYIMNHLRPRGRAGIIVPEGIIFQSAMAHKKLRENLLNDGLYAVVSLPAGVFQPYSGVKTSILLLDNELARRNTEILFVKIENDGFDLGSTKRPINKNDLPQALEIIQAWQSGKKIESKIALYVEKAKIIERGDYNLSGDLYRVTPDYSNAKWPMVELGRLCDFLGKGTRPASFATEKGKVLFFVSSLDEKRCDFADFEMEALVIGDGGSANIHYVDGRFSASDHTYILKNKNEEKVLLKYIYLIIRNNLNLIEKGFQGQGLKNVSKKHLQSIKIPLPPLEVQEQIVAEVDGYQKIISGARQIVEHWKPNIKILDDVDKVKVGKVVDFVSGVTLAVGDCLDKNGVPIITIADVSETGILKLENLRRVKTDKNVNVLQKGDLLFNWRNGSKHLVGKTAYFDLEGEYIFASFLLGIRAKKELIDSKFLWVFLNKYRVEGKYLDFMRQNVNGLFNREELKDVVIPFPSLEIQKQIVEEIEAERALVESSKKLIEIYEQKIKDVLSKLWEK